MKNNVHQFKENLLGNDYVVGDIHGHFKDLETLLNKINFDKKKDRLFSVGDLCDRGPHSSDVLNWLKYHWFFPVLGNHEEILLLHHEGRVDDTTLYDFHADWWIDEDEKNKKDIIKKYQALPIAIEVQTSNGLVGIIHAECPHADWKKLPDLLNSPSTYLKAKSKALWSPDSPSNHHIVKNVRVVFVGHMTQKKIKINGNVYLIDTGSGFRNGFLTVFNINTLENFNQICE